jgi:hypothetical protein
MEYHSLKVAAQAIRCKLFGIADSDRWTDASTFAVEWDERSHIIGELIPAKSRVLDFGAGRRQLSFFIDPSCTYLASDFMDRGAGTIIIDLNTRPLPNLANLHIDVAVFAGVIEYVQRIDTLAKWLSNNVSTCIVSYGCVPDEKLRGARRLREAWKRARCGWLNSFTESEVIKIFEDAGFAFDCARDWHTLDGSERIFSFRSFGSLNPLTQYPDAPLKPGNFLAG